MTTLPDRRPRHDLMFNEPRWIKGVTDGTIWQTIRKAPARPFVPGSRLRLQRWQGTPYQAGSLRVTLRDDLVCVSVDPITFTIHAAPLPIEGGGGRPRRPVVTVGGRVLDDAETDALCVADGFKDAAEFCDDWYRPNGPVDQSFGVDTPLVLVRWATITGRREGVGA